MRFRFALRQSGVCMIFVTFLAASASDQEPRPLKKAVESAAAQRIDTIEENGAEAQPAASALPRVADSDSPLRTKAPPRLNPIGPSEADEGPLPPESSMSARSPAPLGNPTAAEKPAGTRLAVPSKANRTTVSTRGGQQVEPDAEAEIPGTDVPRTDDDQTAEPQTSPAEPKGAAAPASEAKPADGEKAGTEKVEEPLKPIPDPKYVGPAELETTSFKGVTPGVTTLAEVQKSWGQPKELQKQDNLTMHLYSVDPFPRVEVTYVGDKVASIIIRFEKGFATATVAQQLDLAKIQPVLISSELGEILGQSYPERGVLFSFEPSQTPGKLPTVVTHIILEPITAEPFALRAETNLEVRPEFSLHDLDEALKIQPGNARAHWLRSRALAALGEHDKAAAAAGEAARLEPNDARYRVTHALLLGQVGRVTEAVTEAKNAAELSQNRAHVKVRALCLLGDLLGAGPKPDFQQALQYHTQAVQEAEPLTNSKHPAIRVAAKEALVDAHLGAAHDIAWGSYREKERAVDTWLSKAAAGAEDLIANEHGADEYRFRVSARALAAYAGLHGGLDPQRWVKEAVRSGEAMIAATPDMKRKSQLQWEIGMALYDGLQVYQMRTDPKAALDCGELAIGYLEKSGRQGQSAASNYVLGRLYFRLGAIRAMGAADHRAAVQWFDKAVPLLGKSYPKDVIGNLGRHGETFVSMGVSYWEAGQREKAVALTQHGMQFMEEAVAQGALDKAALAVPYGNLASMHRELGQTDKAERFDAMATKNQGAKLR